MATAGSKFRPALQRALMHALSHLQNLDRRPVSASAIPHELRARFDRPLTDGGVEAVQVIDDIAADAGGGIVGSAADASLAG